MLISLATRRSFLLAVTAMLAVSPAVARDKEVWTNFWGLALNGYDPVAYFTEGRPVEGASEHAAEWNGAEWRFASAANREAFLADPEKYAPQFGGYCAWAVSRGYTASTDPDAWEIVGDKLYLNYSLSVRDQWRQDRAGNIAKGERNWPKVLE
ncbi:MAG: YHS domain-containing protein [Rhodobacteraceae bacterium]|nr:YHS domain-containing protein [Paracoccaceae bacterium]